MYSIKNIFISLALSLILHSCGSGTTTVAPSTSPEDDPVPTPPVSLSCSESGPCIIFVTISSSSGNLGGISGADAVCNSDINKPNASAYKALLSDPGVRGDCSANDCSSALDWPLLENRTYLQNDSIPRQTIGTTNANRVFSFNLDNPISALFPSVFVGLNADWTNSGSDCSGWTSPAADGSLGSPSAISSAALLSVSLTCNTVPSHIYCVEQP